MRLSPQLIDLISRRMVRGLIERGVLSSDHPERTVERVARLIGADLAIEDRITEEARQILLEYQGQIQGAGEIEYHKLLLKVKSELAAKRGYVL